MIIRGIAGIILILLMMVIGVGCINSNTRINNYSKPNVIIPIYIDWTFNEAEVSYIAKAVDEWNWSLNGSIYLWLIKVRVNSYKITVGELVEERSWIVMKAYSWEEAVDAHLSLEQRGKLEVIGFTDQIGGNRIWLVMDRVMGEKLYGVMMHEIGHLMGLSHDEKLDKSLMYPQMVGGNYNRVDAGSMGKIAEKYQILGKFRSSK